MTTMIKKVSRCIIKNFSDGDFTTQQLLAKIPEETSAKINVSLYSLAEKCFIRRTGRTMPAGQGRKTLIYALLDADKLRKKFFPAEDVHYDADNAGMMINQWCIQGLRC